MYVIMNMKHKVQREGLRAGLSRVERMRVAN